MTNTTLDSADTVYGDQYDLAVGVAFLLLSVLGIYLQFYIEPSGDHGYHPRHPGQRADGGGAGPDQAPLQPLHAAADEPGCG